MSMKNKKERDTGHLELELKEHSLGGDDIVLSHLDSSIA